MNESIVTPISTFSYDGESTGTNPHAQILVRPSIDGSVRVSKSAQKSILARGRSLLTLGLFGLAGDVTDADDLVGFFTGTLVSCFRLSPGEGFSPCNIVSHFICCISYCPILPLLFTTTIF